MEYMHHTGLIVIVSVVQALVFAVEHGILHFIDHGRTHAVLERPHCVKME